MSKRICYLLILLFTSSNIIYSQEITYKENKSFIILKSGKILKGKINFDRKIGYDFLISFNDTLKIDVNDIKVVSNSKGTFATYHKMIKKNKKFLYENIFLKRIREGKVLVFSEYHPFIKNQSGESYQYYSMKSGNIKQVNYTNLKKSLFDNPQSANTLGQYDLYKKLSERIFWIGLSSTIYGILSERPEGEFITYFGIACSFSSIVPFFMKSNKLQRAIDEYNK